MKKHIFTNVCIDFEEILSTPKFEKMLRTAYKQAKTNEAIRRTSLGEYKDHNDNNDEWSPMYYGLFVEWFAQEYLNHFGHLFNLSNVQMLEHVGSAEQDNGVDGTAISTNAKKGPIRTVACKRGSPVYIQVKGTLNPTKEHTANDGSRLPNFFMNAYSTAIQTKCAYQARYIVFTTGKGLHYRLEDMCNHLVEVINFKKITKLVNGDHQFLNILRESVGLESFELPQFEGDPEGEYNEKHFEEHHQITKV